MFALEIIMVCLLGMILGSFFACVGYRIPNKISISQPNSFCPNCKKNLKWYMNIPIFSYILLKGKCAFCNNRIGLINFIVELFTTISFLIFFLQYGFTINFFIAIVLISVTSVTIVSDFLYYYVSDRTIIIGSIFILFLYLTSTTILNTIYYISSGICIFFLMYLIKLLGDKKYKRESLGGGDIKIMGLVGLAIGLIPSLLSLGIASFIGLIYAIVKFKNTKGNIIPFGPFLLVGALIILYLLPIISIYY